MDEEQIKAMTERFLSWKLPADFSPDSGISFKAEFNENTAHPMRHEPTGTNLLNYTQARDMIIHILGWWRWSLVSSMMGDVRDFHMKFNQGYDGPARVLPLDLYNFRVKFIKEETTEYELCQESIEDELSLAKDDRDEAKIEEALADQLDALADQAFVVLGTAYLQFGEERFNEAWRRVVKANMAKVRADEAPEGSTLSGREKAHDIVKPPGWVAPDHSDLVKNYVVEE